MGEFISVFDVAFIVFLLLLYLLVPLLVARRKVSVGLWSLEVFVWVCAFVASLYLILEFQSSFYVEAVAFWCFVAGIIFYIIHRAGDELLAGTKVSKDEIKRTVLEIVSKLWKIPKLQIATNSDLALYKEDASEAEILCIILVAEKELGINRSGGIDKIRTVDEIVDYLSGEDINKKSK